MTPVGLRHREDGLLEVSSWKAACLPLTTKSRLSRVIALDLGEVPTERDRLLHWPWPHREGCQFVVGCPPCQWHVPVVLGARFDSLARLVESLDFVQNRPSLIVIERELRRGSPLLRPSGEFVNHSSLGHLCGDGIATHQVGHVLWMRLKSGGDGTI